MTDTGITREEFRAAADIIMEALDMTDPIGTSYTCLRCGHHWHSRKAGSGPQGRPKSCGACKTVAWDKAPVVTIAMEGMR